MGSNLPDRDAHLDAAIRGLASFVDDLRESRRYESDPRDNIDQPRFLNSVAVGTTRLDPFELLDRIHAIEALEGRNRSESAWRGPRPLDIDLLIVGELTLDTAVLAVPHPRMCERKFVLLPLLELDPELIDPRSGRRFFDFFTNLEDQGIYYHSLEEFQ